MPISRYLLLLLLLLLPAALPAQVPMGKEFIVALPSVLTVPERNSSIATFSIEVICPRKTTVTAKWGNGGALTTQLIDAGGRALITKPYIFLWQLMQNPDISFSERINKSCIVITTDEPVSVMGVLDTNNRTETYAVWPTTSYDTNYRVLTFAGLSTGQFNTPTRSGFIVMAREDATDVFITPSVATLGGHVAGIEYVVRLNRNDLYEVKANESGRQHNSDMTGTRIRSSKGVGLLSFSYTNVGTYDYRDPIPPPPQQPDLEGSWRAKPIIEHQPPNSMGGTEFYAAPFYDGPNKRLLPPARPQDTAWIRFTALEFNTAFDTNGVRVQTVGGGGDSLINPGGHIDFPVTTPMQIISTKNVIGIYMAPSSDNTIRDTVVDARRDTAHIPFGDPFMMWLPAVNNYKPAAQFCLPILADRKPYDDRRPSRPISHLDSIGGYTWQHLTMIIAPVEAASTVRLDGNPVVFTRTFPGGKYVGAIRRLVPTRHVVEASAPVCVFAYGFTWTDSYGTTASEMLRSIGGVTPDTLRFASCSERKDTTITMINSGTAPLRIDSIKSIGINGSLFFPPTLPLTVAPGASLSMTIRFTLPQPGSYSGLIRLYTDAANTKIFEVPLVVLRDSAQIGLPGTFDFGSLGAGETQRDSTIIIRNNGTTPLILTDVAVIGAGFQVIGSSFPDTIAPGATDTLHLRFTATTDGIVEAKLRFIGGPCLTPLDIIIRGFKGSGPVILVGRSIDYPTFLCTIPSGVDSTLLLRNIGSEILTIDSARISGPHASEFTLLDPLDGRTLLPGDTTSFRVRYAPAGIGDRRAAVTIYSNASNAPSLVIDLRARRDTAALRSLVDTLDFGLTPECSSSPREEIIRLRNDGTVADTIVTVDLGGVGQYSITPGLPIIIAPGTEQEIRVRFAPSGNGSFPTTLLLGGAPCGVQAQLELRGSQSSVGLALSHTAIDFDTLFICNGYAERNVVLTNTGGLPDTISTVELDGASAFTTTNTFPLVIAPGATDTIHLRFTATASGLFTSKMTVRWHPCDKADEVDLSGRVVTPSTRLGADTLDFGSLSVDSTVGRSFVIHNSGDVSRRLLPLDLSAWPGLTVFSPSLPTTILPGDSVVVIVRWKPSRADTLHDSAVVMLNDPCGTSTNIFLRGEARRPVDLSGDFTLVAPDTLALVDDIFTFPISASNGRNLQGVTPTALEFVIRSRYTLFDPRSVKTDLAGASATIIHNRIVGTERFIRVRLTLGTATLPNNGELLRIQSLALLGDTDRTALTLDSVTATMPPSSSLTIATKDGSYQTLGICRTGGERYIRLRGGLATRIVRPNPTNSDATLEYTTGRDMQVQIAVYDLYGSTVAILQDEAVSSGTHTATFHGGGVASGLYRIEVRSEGETASQWIMVIR